MSESRKNTAPVWVDPDDAPDLSTPEWVAKFRAVPVQRGRPKADAPKKAVSLRLAPDLLAEMRASGKGWQTRAEAVLRKAVASGKF